MRMISVRAPLAIATLAAILSAFVFAEEEPAPAAVSAEIRETAELIQKAPFVLTLATAQYHIDTKRWPAAYKDIDHVVRNNPDVLPSKFGYRRVTFTTRSRKECLVEFAFDWPTLEGGAAEGTIVMKSAGSLKDMARAAKVTWTKPPRLRADLLPPDAKDRPAPAAKAD